MACVFESDLTRTTGLRFFQRIAKTYRSEQWEIMLHSILSMWCECARQSGDVDATVPLLLEMIGSSKCTVFDSMDPRRGSLFAASVSAEGRISLEEELTEILKVRHVVEIE